MNNLKYSNDKWKNEWMNVCKCFLLLLEGSCEIAVLEATYKKFLQKREK